MYFFFFVYRKKGKRGLNDGTKRNKISISTEELRTKFGRTLQTIGHEKVLTDLLAVFSSFRSFLNFAFYFPWLLCRWSFYQLKKKNQMNNSVCRKEREREAYAR